MKSIKIATILSVPFCPVTPVTITLLTVSRGMCNRPGIEMDQNNISIRQMHRYVSWRYMNAIIIYVTTHGKPGESRQYSNVADRVKRS